jgi:hypothetical protein
MGWVNDALQELSAGRRVQIRPSGGSMRGRIESGDLVTLAPVAPSEVRVDDIVLVRWKGNYLLHLIREVQGDEFVIGNNLGKINGMVKGSDIRARVIEVAHDAKPAEPGASPNVTPAERSGNSGVSGGPPSVS